MSQSAASEALLNLEHTYQVSLFDRVSNKLDNVNAAFSRLGVDARITCSAYSERHNGFLNNSADWQSRSFGWHDYSSIVES